MGQACGKESAVLKDEEPREEATGVSRSREDKDPQTEHLEEVQIEQEKKDEEEEEEQTLLQKLMKVEGNREMQDQLFSSLKSNGAIMICTLAVKASAPELLPEKLEKSAGGCGCMGTTKAKKKASTSTAVPQDVSTKKDKNEEALRSMALTSFLRALVASRVWVDSVELVKTDEGKFFAFSTDVQDMLKAAAKIVKLADEFPNWLPNVAPRLGGNWRVEVKIGIEAGDVLLLPGEDGDRDCYGDPVNVASKLGEDLAKAGEIFLGPHCYQLAAHGDTSAAWLKDMSMKEGSVEISGTKLEYHCGEVASLAKCWAGPVELPKESELEDAVHMADLHPETRVVFVSDMSGFTKLTKKHGILHYLRLVLSVREIMVPLISAHGGRVLKYDGDNIIAVFNDCNQALISVDKAWRQIGGYNQSRNDEDFQIRMGCGMCHGELLIHGKDIHGDAFKSSFFLAEDVAEKFEVLVTDSFSKATKWPELPEHLRACVLKKTSNETVGQISHLQVETAASH